MDGVTIERFRYAPTPLQQLAYDGGIPAKLRRQPWLALLVPLFVMAQLLAARRFVRSWRPTIVHAHWVITGGLVGRLLRATGQARFRLVVTAHGGDIYGLQHPLAIKLKRWVLSGTDAITAVSPSLSIELQRLGAEKSRTSVLAMGADLRERFTPNRHPEEQPLVVYAGRLVAKKGVDTLLQAFAQLRHELPDCRLAIAGHGPEHTTLKRMADALGIADAVDMSGPYRLRELPGLYAKASLAVFPFRIADGGDQDGLPTAIVEAMGCEVPVIASDLPILTTLVQDQVSGLSVPPNDPSALAQAMLALLRDPDRAERLARIARQRVLSAYDWSKIADGYARILTDAPPLPAP